MKTKLISTLLTLIAGLAVPAGAIEDKKASEKTDTFESIREEHRKKMGEFFGRMTRAKTDEERKKIGADFPRPRVYVNRMLKVVERAPDSPDAVRGLVWILQNSGYAPEAGEAVTRLAERHADSLAIEAQTPFTLEYSQAKDVDRLLNALIGKNPDAATRAAAMLVKGRRLMRSDPVKGESIFERVVADYPKAEVMERSIAKMAAVELFELRNLGIGKPAPEIEGEDIDGVKFKLSDYRGKVVVIDFWGDW